MRKTVPKNMTVKVVPRLYACPDVAVRVRCAVAVRIEQAVVPVLVVIVTPNVATWVTRVEVITDIRVFR